MGKIKSAMVENYLKKMKNVDIKTIDCSKLQDISGVNIDSDKPVIQRLLKYISEIKNPYAFKVGKTKIKVVFSNRYNAQSIQRGLENIVRNKTV